MITKLNVARLNIQSATSKTFAAFGGSGHLLAAKFAIENRKRERDHAGGIMHISLTATLDCDEDATVSTIYAMCKELGVEVNHGDLDGRHWVNILGTVDEAD